MTAPKTKRYIVRMDTAIASVIEAQDVRVDETGCLVAYYGRGVTAAFAPGGWLSCVEDYESFSDAWERKMG